MKRQNFIKSALLGLGGVSISTLGLAQNKVLNEVLINEPESLANSLPPKILKNGEGIKLAVIGDQQTVKLTGKDTNNQYTLVEEYNEPGTQIPLHVHESEDEVFHLLEGELEVQIGNEFKQLKTGDIIFCPRGVPHAWKVIGDSKAKVMLSVFPSGIENLFFELAQLPEGPPDFKKVTQMCEAYNIKFL
jgi:quercetin dioxygenase-like cupin family protein